jgi:hypothetical protein
MNAHRGAFVRRMLQGRLIHVVAADNFDDKEMIVITVYETDHPNGIRIVGRGSNEMRYLQKGIDKAWYNHSSL